VEIGSITAFGWGGDGDQKSLLPTPISSFLDSSLPYISLPMDACQLFEKAFELIWDNATELYPSMTHCTTLYWTLLPALHLRLTTVTKDLQSTSPSCMQHLISTRHGHSFRTHQDTSHSNEQTVQRSISSAGHSSKKHISLPITSVFSSRYINAKESQTSRKIYGRSCHRMPT